MIENVTTGSAMLGDVFQYLGRVDDFKGLVQQILFDMRSLMGWHLSEKKGLLGGKILKQGLYISMGQLILRRMYMYRKLILYTLFNADRIFQIVGND